MAEERVTEAQMDEKELNRLVQVRYDKFNELKAAGKNPFVITKYDVTAHAKEVIDNFDSMEGKKVSIAGRMMQKRVITLNKGVLVSDKKGGYSNAKY